MTFSIRVLAFLFLQGLKQATGHYGFPVVVIDGVVSERWEYIRPTLDFGPGFDYSGPDSMCGKNATTPLFPVKTLKVEAGSTVGFGAMGQAGGPEYENKRPFEPSFRIYHDGPATAYLSKAPGELNDYTGDGDWFKIAVIGSSDGMTWDINSMKQVNVLNFTIPKTTPPGKYLLRAEHLNILQYYKGTQMYVNCAHIEITGPGGGKPEPMTKFPGAFDAKDPGIWLPNVLYNPYQPMDELKNWQGAGPKVWKG